MTIAAYVRLSSEKKDEAEIENWLQYRGIDRYQVEWIGDKENDRKRFDKLQQAIESGQVKCVVLWKLDRLSRRLRDTVNILADWANRGLKLVVVSQRLEIDGSEGRRIATLLRGLTEAEQEFRKEQQQAGIAVARKKGAYKGRKQGTTKANLEKARELKEGGLSSAAIADELGISKRTAFRYLLRSQAAGGESRKVSTPNS